MTLGRATLPVITLTDDRLTDQSIMHNPLASDVSDDETLDYSPFSSICAPSNLLFDLNHTLEAPNPPIQLACTRALRERLAPGTAADKVLKVPAFMDGLGINLPIFLDLLSWGDSSCIDNGKINHERTSLMVSEELPTIIARWHKPPRSPGSMSARADGGSRILERFAFDTVTTVLDTELEGVQDIMRTSAAELSMEAMTGFQVEDFILKLSSQEGF